MQVRWVSWSYYATKRAWLSSNRSDIYLVKEEYKCSKNSWYGKCWNPLKVCFNVLRDTFFGKIIIEVFDVLHAPFGIRFNGRITRFRSILALASPNQVWEIYWDNKNKSHKLTRVSSSQGLGTMSSFVLIQSRRPGTRLVMKPSKTLVEVKIATGTNLTSRLWQIQYMWTLAVAVSILHFGLNHPFRLAFCFLSFAGRTSSCCCPEFHWH